MSSRDLPALSRRRFFNAAAGLGVASAAGLTVSCTGAAGTTGGHPPPAVRGLANTVLDAFRTHRLVGIGEVHHLQQHHDVLDSLLNDPRLPGVVSDIVVEFGNAHYQDIMDRFIAGQPVDNAGLRLAWRNTTQSPEETWDQPVYEQFFRAVRAANWALPPGQQMRVLLADPPINWATITNASDLEPAIQQRDTYPASLVEQQVLAKGRRALLCYGMAHLFHPVPTLHTQPNLVSIIEQRTGERTYTIADLVPLAGDPGGLATRLASYTRNTVVPATGTWLASFDAGLFAQLQAGSRSRRPARNGSAAARSSGQSNPLCGVPAGSVIDDGLYLGQPGDLTASCWNPAIFLDPAYWAELERRNALKGHPVDLDSYRQQQTALFPLLKVPPSAECGQATHGG
jgi:hypothetical protein